MEYKEDVLKYNIEFNLKLEFIWLFSLYFSYR